MGGKTGQSSSCYFQTHHICSVDSSTIPVTVIVKFLSTSIEMISLDTMKEESQRLHKVYLELDAIFISVFINRAEKPGKVIKFVSKYIHIIINIIIINITAIV